MTKPVPAAHSRLAALFDWECREIGPRHGAVAAPRDALLSMQGVLSRVAEHRTGPTEPEDGPESGSWATGDPDVRRVHHAVEAVRAALAVLDAVVLVTGPAAQLAQPPPASRWDRITRLLHGGPAPGTAAHRIDPGRAQVRMDAVLDAVRSALESVDALVDVHEPGPAAPQRPTWAADERLIDLVHTLLGASARANGGFALRRIDLLVDELAVEHDIHVVSFDGTNPHLFDFVPSPNPADTTPRTVSPALVCGASALLRRGEVRQRRDPDPDDPAPHVDGAAR
jgi:hypothetical protein